MKHKIIYFSILLVFFGACKRTGNIIDENKETATVGFTVDYAKGFTVTEHAGYTDVCVLDPWDTSRILKRYILVDKQKEVPEKLPEGTLIRTPLKRVVSYSSVNCGMLVGLNQPNVIVGVCEPEYIDIPVIQEKIKAGTIINVGLASSPDVEKIMDIEPEAILASPLEGVSYGQVEKTGIPIIECVDYMEPTPLGRAEWIRFHALFYGEKALGDSLFRNTVDAYNQIKELAAQVSYRPTVFTEMKYGNAWHVPGGNSYAAHLLKDAGANYCWADEPSSGSKALAFEIILDKAEKADTWLIKYNNTKDMSYADLANIYEPYTYFDAYKNKHIFGCNTAKVTYYEDLPIHPDYILKDLVWVFHPELLPEYEPRYYKKLGIKN